MRAVHRPAADRASARTRITRSSCPTRCGCAYGWLTEDDRCADAPARKPSREFRVEQVREAIEWSQRSARQCAGSRAGPASGRRAQPRRRQRLAEDAGGTSWQSAHRAHGHRPGTLAADTAQPSAARAIAGARCCDCDDVVAAAGRGRGGRAAGSGWRQPDRGPDAGRRRDRCAGVAGIADAGFARRCRVPERQTRLPASSISLLKIAHDAMAQAGGRHAALLRRGPHACGRADLARLQAWRLELLRVARHDDHPWNAALLVECARDEWRALLAGVAPARRAGRTGHSLHSTR